ncbi:MAG: energy-coupling factor transporter transmembrane protein EcfT [Anaerolineaceae bacterium]|nr:energy-coupling factor transporter transmembrane protein EcfT [Anaerolineaceae bacterium]
MLKFQTVGRDSFFTKLDFRPKLLMIVVISIIAFVWENPIMVGALAILIIVSCLLVGVRWSYIRTILLIMLPFYIILLLTHGFFNVDQVKTILGVKELKPMVVIPDNWWLIGGGTITWEGFFYGITIIFKTLCLTLIIPLGIFTTEVDNMIVGMVRSKIPYKIAFIFSSTLRFFPLLFQEIQNIIEAQRLRGLAMEKMGPVKRVRVYSKVAIPLILGAMVKSQQLEVVLQSKAFSGDSDRTYIHQSILHRLDWILIAVFLLFFIVSLVLYVGFGIGKFFSPV